MITINKLIESGAQRLKTAGIDEALAHAELTLAFVLNKTRTHIKAFGQNIVFEKEQKLFDKIVEQKIEGKPLAHIIGEWEFMGHLLNISPTVLIPRPETEELIQKSLRRLKTHPHSVLDLCSGSGCIAISLAFLLHAAKISAVDISDEALVVAIKNAQNLNVHKRVSFIKSDLFKALPEGEKFDFIITNPPYIPTEVIATLSPEVKSEPMLALDGGPEGLSVIKRIVKDAPARLNAGGLFAMEIGCDQAEKVLKLFKKTVWSKTETEKDINGVERFIFAVKK